MAWAPANNDSFPASCIALTRVLGSPNEKVFMVTHW